MWSVLEYFTHRRFNMIDGFSFSAFGAFMVVGSPIYAILALFVLGLISVRLEKYTDKE